MLARTLQEAYAGGPDVVLGEGQFAVSEVQGNLVHKKQPSPLGPP